MAKRTRSAVACARCKASKIKCSNYRPCKNCASFKVSCKEANSKIETNPQCGDSKMCEQSVEISEIPAMLSSPQRATNSSNSLDFEFRSPFVIGQSTSLPTKTTCHNSWTQSPQEDPLYNASCFIQNRSAQDLALLSSKEQFSSGRAHSDHSSSWVHDRLPPIDARLSSTAQSYAAFSTRGMQQISQPSILATIPPSAHLPFALPTLLRVTASPPYLPSPLLQPPSMVPAPPSLPPFAALQLLLALGLAGRP